jgi:hypothetical protein
MGPWESMPAVGRAARAAGQRPADTLIRARRARFWPGGAAFLISSGAPSGAAFGRRADRCSPSEVLAGRRRLSYLQRRAKRGGVRPRRRPVLAERGSCRESRPFLSPAARAAGQRPADTPIRARQARFWPGVAALLISSGPPSRAASGRCADPCSPSEALAGSRGPSYLQRPAQRGSFRPTRRSVLAERGSGREAPPFLSPAARQAGQRPADARSSARRARPLPGVAALLISKGSTVRSPPCPR